MSFGMSNWRVQTGVRGMLTLHGGVVVFSVLFHCGLTVLFELLKDECTFGFGDLGELVGLRWYCSRYSQFLVLGPADTS